MNVLMCTGVHRVLAYLLGIAPGLFIGYYRNDIGVLHTRWKHIDLVKAIFYALFISCGCIPFKDSRTRARDESLALPGSHHRNADLKTFNNAVQYDSFDYVLQIAALLLIGFFMGYFICCWKRLYPESAFIVSVLMHHLSEYTFVASFHPHELTFDSLLLNNTTMYSIAMIAAVTETHMKSYLWSDVANSLKKAFFAFLPYSDFLSISHHVVMKMLFPQIYWIAEKASFFFAIKTSDLNWETFTSFAVNSLLSPNLLNHVATLGLVMAYSGLVCRWISLLTCGHSFSHTLASSKRDNHKLVTHGIYRYVRHPSYMGWFYWAIGSQLLLGNFICSVMFWIVSRNFFLRRIKIEESFLHKIFGDEFEYYRIRTTRTGVPGI